jgi:penicillin-binding protein 1A
LVTFWRWLRALLLTGAALGILAALLLSFAVLWIYPRLPGLDALTDYRPKIPLRIYSADGYLIGEFGEERRNVVRIEDVPENLKRAIVAVEDARFWRHHGIDYIGVLRATWANLSSFGVRQGASTITMQLARNFFLSSERSFQRKLYEGMLAFKIEGSLTKPQILQLYINQIFLGQRAYGFASAAQIYFGKPLERLTLGEMAMLAGLPKSPSKDNPIINPKRASARKLIVLERMLAAGFITEQQRRAAADEPLRVSRTSTTFATKADFIAEMVRARLFAKYGESVYRQGFSVITTINKTHQDAAYAALRDGVLSYDKRHGYRGPEGFIDLDAEPAQNPEWVDEQLDENYPDLDDLISAVVIEADKRHVVAQNRFGNPIEISGDGLTFAKKMLDSKAPVQKRIRRGSVIRLQFDVKKARWNILQRPSVESAFIAIDPRSGAIRALVGGFDFSKNPFNHVTQAWRQPGSSFKPFVYSAALEKGFTPATVINDAPLEVPAEETGSQVWAPQNFDGTYDGPMRMRSALARSKNLVSIRILQAIGTQYAQEYVGRFGFDTQRHPPYLTMALGAGSVTPWQMARAYSVFANGGYRVLPFFIARIVDPRGKVVAEARPLIAGDNAPRVIDARNAYLMHSMLQDVTRYGTAARAGQLGRGDIAGKTGTTNDFVDAWFAGYQATMTGVAWIGFDQPHRLGGNETGGHAALPIWIAYMEKALKGVPPAQPATPEGVVHRRVDPATGLPVSDGGVVEFFYEENSPIDSPLGESSGRNPDEVREQLY